jgi:L-serine dehydratase
MDFNSGQELLAICTEKGLPISAVMKERELANTGIDQETLQERLREIGAIFVQSATAPLTDPGKSMGGLIGGEAQKLHAYYEQNALPGGFFARPPWLFLPVRTRRMPARISCR